MRYLPVVLLTMLFLSPAARAEDDCEGETQYEMNVCAGHKFEKADKVMNERYTKLMKRLDPEDQGKLRQAQRAWISYRDKVCEFGNYPGPCVNWVSLIPCSYGPQRS